MKVESTNSWTSFVGLSGFATDFWRTIYTEFWSEHFYWSILQLRFLIVAAKRSFQHVILFGSARVIALFTRVVKTVFFFAFVSDVKIITKWNWTSEIRETSCKIIHDKYNADPLFVLRGKAQWQVDEWRIVVWRPVVCFSLTQDSRQHSRDSLEDAWGIAGVDS